MTCTPQALISAASVLRFLPTPLLRSMQINLLCQWATHLTPPVAQFEWLPHSALVTWTDDTGPQATDYPTFLATAHIPLVTSVVADGLGITGILNLSALPALTTFACDFNPGLTSIDVSGCTNLTYLSLDNNGLTELDCTGLLNLITLYCDYNSIGTGGPLTLTGCVSLQHLTCTNNALTSMNFVSALTSLLTLDCSSNPIDNLLTPLDFTGQSNLTALTCSSCGATSLTLTGCSGIIILDCSYNSIPVIDVTDCVSINNFNCNNGAVTSIVGLDAGGVFSNLFFADATVNLMNSTDVSIYVCQVDTNYNNSGIFFGSVGYSGNGALDLNGQTCLFDLVNFGNWTPF